MKKIALFMLIASTSTLWGQQNSSQPKDIIFFDKCTNKNIEIEHSLKTPSSNVYVLRYIVRRGEWTSEIVSISAGRPIDSIIIRRISRFTHRKDSLKRRFLTCNQLSQGKLKEYGLNGKILLEGDFQQGIPKEVKHYHFNGQLSSHSVYQKNSLFDRETYDYLLDGTFFSHYTHERKGNKILVKEFDKKGKLLEERLEDISKH